MLSEDSTWKSVATDLRVFTNGVVRWGAKWEKGRGDEKLIPTSQN